MGPYPVGEVVVHTSACRLVCIYGRAGPCYFPDTPLRASAWSSSVSQVRYGQKKRKAVKLSLAHGPGAWFYSSVDGLMTVLCVLPWSQPL